MREPAEWPERVDADLIDQDDRALTRITERKEVKHERHSDQLARTWRDRQDA